MRLEILHPTIAHRDCGHCEAWLYDDRTGEPCKSGGKLIPRPKGTAPCRLRKDGCPKGTPETSKALTEQNQAAYRHFLECRAVECFPDDATVRRHAAIIRAAETIAMRELDFDRLGPLAGLLTRG